MATKSRKKIIDFISGLEVLATSEEIEAVQVFSKQLVEDYGYRKSQITTRPQFRVKASPSDTKGRYPVDIAVFRDSQKRTDDVYIIVECKKKNRTDGRGQLEDYLRLSRASLGVWFNGKERLFLKKREERGQVLFDEIPNIPKVDQRVEDIGKFKRKELTYTHNLKAIFKSIRNHLAANSVGATRDEVLAQQLINLIFCKIYDEKFAPPESIVQFRAGVNEPAEVVDQRIRQIFNKVKSSETDIFEEEDKITLDTKSIVYVVGELQNYSLMSCDRDVVADAFETFIGHALKGGQGQFFTPRNVVRMIIDILNPNINDKIVDPACGSGGFLIESLKFVWDKIDDEYRVLGWSNSDIQRHKIKVATSNFRGIDKDYFLSKVAKAYMTLVGDGTTGIFCDDSLENPKNWSSETKNKIKLNLFDILITNPPFGSKIPVTGEAKLKEYEFGYKWKFNKKSKRWSKTSILKNQEEPQVLFIERCLSLLKDGGKMAMVLPNGILGNHKEAYLREYILEKGNLFAIVELPFETFSPNVTINTSVLFIKKGQSAEINELFISINEHCGHDKKGRPTDKDDIPKVANYFRTRASNSNNFFIASSMLEDSFIAKRYLRKYVNNIEKIESGEFPVVNLGSLVATIHNGANIEGASAYVDRDDGLPYILVKSITKEGINFENLKYIRKDLIDNYGVGKNIVTESNVVITRAGNAGIASNIPPDLVNGVASGFLININVDLTKVNQYYLVAFLNSEYGQIQLERIASGSIQESIRLSELKRIKVILPPREIQDRIGKKLKESVYANAEIRRQIKNADNEIAKLVSD